MTWVKRGGGAGTGYYGGGLATVVEATGQPTVPRRPEAPADHGNRPTGEARAQRTPAPAYRVTQERQALDHKIVLDLLAQWAGEGNEPELSMYYEDARADFGADSPHFIGACKGQIGAGAHYLRTVSGGAFRAAR
jgi:hypothetical protein